MSTESEREQVERELATMIADKTNIGMTPEEVLLFFRATAQKKSLVFQVALDWGLRLQAAERALENIRECRRVVQARGIAFAALAEIRRK